MGNTRSNAGVVVTWSNLSDQETIPYYLEGVNPEYAEKAAD
jgi:hypothetical protein